MIIETKTAMSGNESSDDIIAALKEERDLWQKSEKECNEAYKKLSDECEKLKSAKKSAMYMDIEILLRDFMPYLEDNGFIDSDWRDEPTDIIDCYIVEKKQLAAKKGVRK